MESGKSIPEHGHETTLDKRQSSITAKATEDGVEVSYKDLYKVAS